MTRSFLNIFLPEDEFKRSQVLYFMAETTFLTVLFLLVFGLLKYVFNFNLNTELLVLLGPFVMMGYTFFRYIFSGIEFTEIYSEKDYKRQRRISVYRSIVFGVVFGVIRFVVSGIPTNMSEKIELIALPIIVMIVYFLLELISLKRSLAKNEHLDE